VDTVFAELQIPVNQRFTLPDRIAQLY
jgi:hypothetical protein